MVAVLDAGPLRARDWLDLLRGALDAWLHPAAPSRVPAVAALVGGGIWTVAAAAVVLQPVPPDWPGYLAEVVPLALVASGCLLVATLGCALRVGDVGGRAIGVAAGLVIAGHLAWIAALAGTAVGVTDNPSLAAAQTLAMIGTAIVGTILVRTGDTAIGLLLLAAPVVMLIPWTVTWLAFGAAWTAIGILLGLEHQTRLPTRWSAS
jgi:hypothetical protein